MLPVTTSFLHGFKALAKSVNGLWTVETYMPTFSSLVLNSDTIPASSPLPITMDSTHDTILSSSGFPLHKYSNGGKMETAMGNNPTPTQSIITLFSSFPGFNMTSILPTLALPNLAQTSASESPTSHSGPLMAGIGGVIAVGVLAVVGRVVFGWMHLRKRQKNGSGLEVGAQNHDESEDGRMGTPRSPVQSQSGIDRHRYRMGLTAVEKSYIATVLEMGG
jgi:hypothetical protein